MSTTPESDFDLELHFLPAWAQKPVAENRYAHFEGESDRRADWKRGRGDFPARRRERREDRLPRGEFRPRPAGGPGQAPGPSPRPSGGPRPSGRDRDRDRGRERERREPLPPPEPLPEVNFTIVPDEKGVDSLARQIRMTGRAYPLFEIAQMILAKAERVNVTLSVRKGSNDQVLQPLFSCAIDDSVWLSEAEAMQHVLEKHFNLFYQAERVQVDPPKGVYTFVAQCGLSGVILGPPNYHDYQNHLRKLHAERFSRMPFETYKSRVKIVKDEAVVKKWMEEQSYKTEYVCLNLPEPLKLTNRDEVEKHFREVHSPNIIKPVDSVSLSGTAARGLRSPGLLRLVRQVWEEQKRFPLQVATVLSQQFAARGLQFFKVNRTFTHVAVARPHYLDLESEPVSEGVRRIVEYINAHPRSTRRQLVEALAPTPPAPPSPPPSAPAVVPEGTAPPAPESAAPAEAPAPLPEQTVVIADLHWLIHQGHVIEFANGTLETAKKPIIKPPKPEPATVPSAPKEASKAPSETALAAPTPEVSELPAASAPVQKPDEIAEAEMPATPSAPTGENIPSETGEATTQSVTSTSEPP